LRPFDDHLLLAVPESSAPALASFILTPLRWERVMDLTPPQRAYPCEGAADMLSHPLSGWYRSPAGVTVVVVVRHFRSPQFIRDASAQDLADPCGLLRCCDEDAPRMGEPFSSEEVDMLTNYSLINIAHVHHVMVDMGLLDAYDYVFKLDADVEVRNTPAVSPGRWMRASGCAFLHAAPVYEVTRGSRHCWLSGVRAMGEFAAVHGRVAASGEQGWCREPSGHYYGNFVGFWRPFIRAPAQRALSRWLFERDEKYFNYNDQGSINLYLCMWCNMAGRDMSMNMTENRMVCDLTEWRYSSVQPSEDIFWHPGD
jgi:hypothetical protein